jgi:pimeloyl-ACP methyl ester carboxylesterase
MRVHKFDDKIIACKNPHACLGDILFVHGYCVDYTYFSAPAGAKLAEHFNVYLLNLPGHATKTNININPKDLTVPKFAEYVMDYIKTKNLNNLILMGHSMGGAIVTMVENKMSSRIKKLILISPYCSGSI